MTKGIIVKVASFFIAMAIAACMVGYAPGQPGEEEKQVLVVTTLDELPDRSHRALEEPLDELPEGYKLQVTIDRFFDQGHTTSTNRFEPYVAQYVPVNPEGNKDGEEHYLSPSNRIYRTVVWEDGVRHGTEKHYNEHPRYLTTEIPWKNGVVEGVRKTYYPNGSLQSETPYKDGQPHGVAKSYSIDGKLTRRCTMNEGERSGKLVDIWPETGNTRRIIHYKDGEVTGVVKEFYVDGQLKREVPFVDNVMHGEEKRYEPDGEPARSRYWIDGDLVSKTEFEVKSSR